MNQKPKQVPCKKCRAQKGQPCRTLTTNKATEFHAVRNYDAGMSQYAYTYVTKNLSVGT